MSEENSMMSETIKAYRKQMKLTQEQLADAMNVTIGAVSKWESGMSNPDITLLPKLAKLFGISMDVLFSFQLMDGSADDLNKKIKDCLFEKNYDKGAEIALDAIRRYPNHFNLIYQSATLFMMQGIETGNKEALEKSIELYQRSCPLIGQNQNEMISELSIQIVIGEALTYLGKKEEAYKHLKKYNYCGINDGLIGVLLSEEKNSQEAFPYLSKCLLNNLSDFVRCTVGFTKAYMMMKDYKSAYDSLNMMFELCNHLRKDGQVSFIDKLQVILLTGMSQVHASDNQLFEAKKCLLKAYDLARVFDSSPDYNAQNIKFYKGDKQIFGDDTGKTAMESVEKIISMEESNADFFRQTWNSIIDKNNKIN